MRKILRASVAALMVSTSITATGLPAYAAPHGGGGGGGGFHGGGGGGGFHGGGGGGFRGGGGGSGGHRPGLWSAEAAGFRGGAGGFAAADLAAAWLQRRPLAAGVAGRLLFGGGHGGFAAAGGTAAASHADLAARPGARGGRTRLRWRWHGSFAGGRGSPRRIGERRSPAGRRLHVRPSGRVARAGALAGVAGGAALRQAGASRR